MESFAEFDPLKAKQTLDTEVAIKAMKRELMNILDSYVGWYDPFCELIQNALDAVEEKASKSGSDYLPQIRILIDIQNNSLTVSDNGTGLTKEKWEQFLAPNFSFKSGKTRGHKGVGATYLAYGFNFIQISTKSDSFSATGKMLGARAWLNEENPAGNPKVQPDPEGPKDLGFLSFESGVSIYLRFDKTTHPGDLKWIKAQTADQWLKILRTKTGLGSIFSNDAVKVTLIVVDSDGNVTEVIKEGTSYFWPHAIVRKSQSYRDIKAKADELFATKGKAFKLPASMMNLDAIFDTIIPNELAKLVNLEPLETEILGKYQPTIYFCYMYSAKVWPTFNESLNLRQGVSVVSGGIQIAANNMPQGEVIQIPLRRNIGRQNQVLFLFHFENCRGDLGRKGFQKEIIEFSTSVARKIMDKPIDQFRYTLRPVTGVKDDLIREHEIDNWKDEMVQHEQASPLLFISDNFFLPTKRISVTSTPTREQDVIALFNQLIAGGVVRGIRIMSTNERFTYDGMYRVVFEEPSLIHIYDSKTNPLGVLLEYVDAHPVFQSKPKILEYKYSLDALIEEFESGIKNPKDIGLIVVWETGNDYEGYYHITSLLDPDNLSERQYHGVTHVMTNLNTGQREMDLIVLKELIEYLNDPVEAVKTQRAKYED